MQPRSSDQSAGMMMTNLTRECIPRCSWKRKDVRDPKLARTATTFLCHVVGSHKKKIQANVEVYHPKEIPIMEIENVDFNNSVEALDQAEKAETGIIGVAVADDKDDDSEDLKPHRVALVVCLVALKVFGVLLGIVLGTYVGRLVAQKLLGEDD